MLLATGTRWSLRIPLATVFIVVGRRWTTWSYLEDELFLRERGSNEALLGRNRVPWIWGVVSQHRRSGWGRLRWRWALELGGIFIVGGGSLCCDSRKRGRVLFYRLRGSRTCRVGSRNEKSGNRSRNWTVPAFKVHWENALETCSCSSPYSYVLATLAYYEGCNISILLRSWFKDAVPLVGISL
jgi:hypothetical protein